jgi:YesN/AraC family two-component response regulator
MRRLDLVVSDMAMPGMSGLDLAVQMLAIRPQLPFVITSGYVDAAAMARAQEIGVRQMIMKPNTVDELSEVLSAVLKEQGTTSTRADLNPSLLRRHPWALPSVTRY